MISRSIERVLRRSSTAALFAVGAFAGSSTAQSVLYNAAAFQPVASSMPEAWRLVTPAGGMLPFRTGDHVEVELPVDELGSQVVVSRVSPWISGNQDVQFEIFGRATASGALISFGIHTLGSLQNLGTFPLPVPTRLAAIRVEHRLTPSGSVSFVSLEVSAWESSRRLVITGHGWYGQQPSPGSWTSLALLINHAPSQDNFGLLFASVGSPLLSTPILRLPTAQGGLLLDPATVSLVHARPLLGAAEWPFVVSFPYDPAVLSAPIHVQAVLGDAFTHPNQPLLYWTRPVTIHS